MVVSFEKITVPILIFIFAFIFAYLYTQILK